MPTKEWLDKIKQDPEKYAAYLERKRAWGDSKKKIRDRDRRKRIRENNPHWREDFQIWIEQDRERIKTDPERRARYLAAQRRRHAQYRSNPENLEKERQYKCSPKYRSRQRLRSIRYHKYVRSVTGSSTAKKQQEKMNYTQQVCTRSYVPWTEDEVQIACDRSYSITEAALLLGRSYSAVSMKRFKEGRATNTD